MRIVALAATALVLLLAAAALPDAVHAKVLTEPTEKGTIDVRLTHDDNIEPSTETKIQVDFLNPTTQRLQEHIDYTITITRDGSQVFGPTTLIHTSPGTITVPIQFQSTGDYSVVFTVEGVLFQPIPPERVSFVIPVGDVQLPLQDAEEAATIPEWIKNSAGWWADGQIDDATFVASLQYLIQNDILVVPAVDGAAGGGDGGSDGDAKIPTWIKKNAGWWADGQIDDATFVASLQYLIAQGIIQVS